LTFIIAFVELMINERVKVETEQCSEQWSNETVQQWSEARHGAARGIVPRGP
jgi:hypothetical protein